MAFQMVTQYAHSPEDIDHYNTDELRQQFLMAEIFVPGDIRLTYTYNDRMIFGGVTPTTTPLEIKLDQQLGVDYFLQRRELGFINIGGAGTVTIDGTTSDVAPHDGYYISMGTQSVLFASTDAQHPAKFYVVSTPTHRAYPSKQLAFKDTLAMPMGDQAHMNKRTIYKYIDASTMATCQLQMGYTVLAPGNSWNTMPAHTHARRMETYLYTEFGDPNTRVAHFLGTPENTKHIWLEPDQAVVNPSYSIHCGVGTTNYAFIWAMCGENQTYDDMDAVDMHDLR
ncbi:5-dehydro-4-deoxy-D-glucuronate isomerase [Levilactobacillus brevis]|nr:5-dehydro-4-deoxy-D-glucuronate isomerase [Levilactobacillus brevis]MBL3536151.1 5-dehydro-4-deoxy-D-glucuronate isomerase [Lactobacillus sp. GPR40-2]MBL3629061.1 5-dehydro-4-deoxy-D-glucuronate isomerase [Lactobacillus sp. GPB7-4]MCB5232925.1 5-dehydro-4-deoxy-D-glucuronate isomerase [Levilactobacillus brevis]MCS8596203.1 5-keto-4-deoxyuronate isomerase [Levilactobacillus brevis]MCT2886275.1 5-keto-4-deoxyuronate isomerase [Levilactobacillus brevis]